MNILLSNEPVAAEAPNTKTSAAKVPSPQQCGVFDLMLSQLMQGIITSPAQPELQTADQTSQTGDKIAATGPAAGTTVETAATPSLAMTQAVQSAFAAAIEGQPADVAAEGDAIQREDQTSQTGDKMAAAGPAAGTTVTTASTPSLTMIQAVQSAFAAAIEDQPASIEDKSLPGSSLRQATIDHQEAQSSSVPDKTPATTDVGINPDKTARPDRTMASQNSAGIVQMPVDALKKAPAIETQQPLVMREIVLSEGSSKDMADLPDPQKRMDNTSLPETLPVNSAEPQGTSRFHAESAERPAAVANAHYLSESMRVEGNRFIITRLDGTSVEISLQPEGLGKLDIGLVLDKGVVNAQIQASSAAGKELIEKKMHDIVSALAQEGITIGGFSVSLKDDRNDFSWSQNESQGRQIQGEPVMTKEYISAPRQLMSQGKVSIFI